MLISVHRNVWTEVVYLQLQCLPNCLHVIIIRDVSFLSLHQVLYLLVSDVAKCIA